MVAIWSATTLPKLLWLKTCFVMALWETGTLSSQLVHETHLSQLSAWSQGEPDRNPQGQSASSSSFCLSLTPSLFMLSWVGLSSSGLIDALWVGLGFVVVLVLRIGPKASCSMHTFYF